MWAQTLIPSTGGADNPFANVDPSKWRFAQVPEDQIQDEIEGNVVDMLRDDDQIEDLLDDLPASHEVLRLPQRTRKVQKVDWETRDHNNLKLGQCGEQFVAELEKRHLTKDWTERPC